MLMHVLPVSLALLAASTSILSSPLRSRTEYAVKDTHKVPRNWHKAGPAPAHKLLHLQIGLKQSQFDELERHLYEGISDLLLRALLHTRTRTPNPSLPPILIGTANVCLGHEQSRRLHIPAMVSTSPTKRLMS